MLESRSESAGESREWCRERTRGGALERDDEVSVELSAALELRGVLDAFDRAVDRAHLRALARRLTRHALARRHHRVARERRVRRAQLVALVAARHARITLDAVPVLGPGWRQGLLRPGARRALLTARRQPDPDALVARHAVRVEVLHVEYMHA